MVFTFSSLSKIHPHCAVFLGPKGSNFRPQTRSWQRKRAVGVAQFDDNWRSAVFSLGKEDWATLPRKTNEYLHMQHIISNIPYWKNTSNPNPCINSPVNAVNTELQVPVNGKSPFFNWKYACHSWWTFHCHVSFTVFNLDDFGKAFYEVWGFSPLIAMKPGMVKTTSFDQKQLQFFMYFRSYYQRWRILASLSQPFQVIWQKFRDFLGWFGKWLTENPVPSGAELLKVSQAVGNKERVVSGVLQVAKFLKKSP